MSIYFPNRRTQFGLGTALATAGGIYNRMTPRQRRQAGNVLSSGVSRVRDYLGSRSSARSARTSSRRAAGGSRGSTVPSQRVYATPQVIAGDGDSKSSFTLAKTSKQVIGKLSKEMTPSIVYNNSAQRLEITEGLQSSAIIGDYFTDTDVGLTFTAQGATALSTKLFIKSCHSEMMIKNQENTAARLKIYDVICKKDTNATTTSPYQAFVAGFADAGTGGTAAAATYVGATPYDNARFTSFFKILNSTPVTLSSGATHTHTVNYAPNRMVSNEDATDVGGSGIGGLTVYSLLVYHGTPINAIDTQTEVTTSPCALDVVQSETYKYLYVHVGSQVADWNNGLDAALSSAGAVMTDIGVELPINEA